MTRTIRLHASGPVETFQYTDSPGSFPEATVVGAPPQWDDGSDASWARSQTDNASTDFRSVTARLDPLPAAVTLDQIVSISIHLRYDTAHPSSETSRAYALTLYDNAHRSSADTYAYTAQTTYALFPQPPDDDLIHEVDYTIYPSSGGVYIDPPLVVDALRGGAWLNAATLLRVPWKRSALTVYEAWIDVEVAADTAIRLWPRDDSRGINAATRVYPQPRAGRVVGGQP